MKKAFLSAVVVAAAVMGASSAQAKVVSISTILSDCKGYSDCLLVFGPNGKVLPSSVYVTEAEENLNGAQYVYKSTLASGNVNSLAYGDAIGLLEPGFTAKQGYSDIVGVFKNADGKYKLAFASDTDKKLVKSIVGFGTIATLNRQAETWLPVNVTSFLSPALQGNGDTAYFVSGVPEISSWLMMLAGFGALGLVGFSRKKANCLAV